jgi:DNA ligase-1
MLGQTLYAPTKTGNIKTWKCSVENSVTGTDTEHPDYPYAPTFVVIQSATKLGGKVVTRKDLITEGKNLGKKNETTPYQQAVSEAESRCRKKLDSGYSLEVPTDVSKAGYNTLGFPQPMLAHKIQDVKDLNFPAWFQPKLDGHRALTTKQDGKMIMYSRKGKLINTMGHILSHLEDKIEEGMFLDGELYCHGKQLQNIGSLIKKEQPGSELVRYNVYDVVLDAPYGERFEKLRHILKYNGEDNPPAFLVPTTKIPDMEYAQKLTKEAIEDGFEGGILRTSGGGYLAGFRSRDLLKIKEFDDSEAEILDVIERKTFTTNGASLKTAKFVCRHLENNVEFSCTVFGTMEEKDVIFRDKEKYIGKILTVKHAGYTKAKKPFHPVALRLREDI